MINMFAVVTIGGVATEFHAMFSERQRAVEWLKTWGSASMEIIPVQLGDVRF